MKTLLLAPAVLLGACAATPPMPGPAACPIASSDWQAWVNAMPGPDSKPKLMISGQVTAPTDGYTFGWSDFRVAESYPVQVFVTLTAMPPAGMATQALVTQQVRGEWPLSPSVGSVTVMCGGKTLARIAPVETAH
jgi:hypothetical protein